MINELKAMAIFVEVINKGSFRAAAKALELSPSVVSYHISSLEKRVGTALLYRSTRKLSLTSDGELFFEKVTEMMQAAEQGLSLLSDQQQQPAGNVCISLPSALSQSPINQQLAEFALAHSKIKLKLNYSDDQQDLIGKGVDLAIRAGALKDSSLKSRALGVIERRLVCSPEYMKTKTPPAQPSDLNNWDWIALQQLAPRRVLRKSRAESFEINFEKRIVVDSVNAMSQFCQSGLGLATLAGFQADELIEQGKVVEVLSDWRVESIPLHLVWPDNVSEFSVTKRLIRYLVKEE
ncbi:MAG: LysR family transcriptional regulator [Kangiellaceae bacterium]|nr:LysR family transcriptional regulator [Kangiellaceae bacterium]